jgi:hypothetical protein
LEVGLGSNLLGLPDWITIYCDSAMSSSSSRNLSFTFCTAFS